jgi:methylenetetrahydrofolate--tRNA-(uracil-5-)-methyltransferase
MMDGTLTVIGGGLAGCEAAWQAAEQGIRVKLFEMRPHRMTGVHTGGYLAELVCSNSLGSNLGDRAGGLLKNELRNLGSMLLRTADATSIPAGGALAVDRLEFSRRVTDQIERHPNIDVIREEVSSIPNSPAIIATGPLTSPSLTESISILTGSEHLFFYDAIAPIVTTESLDMGKTFRGSRYDRGEQQTGDYINCPLNKKEYELFVEALLSAERIELRPFEEDIKKGVKAGIDKYFEGCLPIEILAERGVQSLAFGPMRPVGMIDPRNGWRPYALLQLRQDNRAGSLYNMVGFQTNLKFEEQRRVFRFIPGLERVEFVRYGQMHRNTFIYSPAHLRATLQHRERDQLFFAGQITGVEGYTGNIGTGLLAGLNAGRILNGKKAIQLPETTMLGALCFYVTQASSRDFQPMKANFGILPELTGESAELMGKRERAAAYVKRAQKDLELFPTKS